jgi:tetratricopeptide (TPR) repeat protein
METPTLRLLINKVEGRPWRGLAIAESAGAQGEPIQLREFADARQIADIRWYVERFLELPEGGNLVRARAAEETLKAWARQLRQTLSQSEVCRRWLAAVQAVRCGTLELIPSADTDGPALRLPWELTNVLADSPSPLHDFGISVIRRSYAGGSAIGLPGITSVLRILIVVCRPKTLAFLDPRSTAQAILQLSQHRPQVRIDFVRPRTFGALIKSLENARTDGEPVHVLHFDGHGTILSLQENSGALCFETENGDLDLVTADQFASEVAQFGVPLVMLEACNTSDELSGDDSFALTLLRAGVPNVIAMAYAAHFEMTLTLMATFYNQLLDNSTIAESLLHARRAVDELRSRRTSRYTDSPIALVCDWFIPQLYQSGADLAFRMTPTQPTAKSIAQASPDLGLPPSPRAGFQGRAYELHVLEQAILNHPIISLHGIAGAGKSALAREASYWWVRTGLFDQKVIWVSLSASTTKQLIVQAMQQALRNLIPDENFPNEEEIVRVCCDQRRLIVWDGFKLPHHRAGEGSLRDTADIEEFAARLTSNGSRILLTTRDPRPITSLVAGIDHLNETDAVRLLTALLEAKASSISASLHPVPTPQLLRSIVRDLDCHPHALELFAAALEAISQQVNAEGSCKLASHAIQDHPESRNTCLTASLEPSLVTLTPQAQATLPVLALMKGGGLEWVAGMAARLSPDRWSKVRSEFERAGLIRVHNQLLRPHPLLDSIITASPDSETIHEFLRGIVSLCSSYLEYARSEVPQGVNLGIRASETLIRRGIDLAIESENLLGAWVIVHPFRVFLERDGRRDEAARLVLSIYEAANSTANARTRDTARIALEAAYVQARTEPLLAQRILTDLIDALEGTRDLDTKSDLDQAWALLRQVNRFAKESSGEASIGMAEIDADSDAGALIDRAEELRNSGRLEEASKCATAAVEIVKQSADNSSLSRKLAVLGDIRAFQARNDEAESIFDEALYYADISEDRESAAVIQLAWAKLDLQRNRIEDAIAHSAAALKVFRGSGDKHGQILALSVLGDSERHRQEFTGALAWFDQAIELAEQVNDQSAIALARGNRALVLGDQARQSRIKQERDSLLVESLAENEAVLKAWEKVGHPINVGKAHTNLANALRELGQLDDAEQHGRVALDILEELGHPDTIGALLGLELVAEAKGDKQKLARWQSRRIVAEAWLSGKEVEPKIPIEMARKLVEMAVGARRLRSPIPASVGFQMAGIDLDHLFALEPGFGRNLLALATEGAPRPSAKVLSVYRPLVDDAWNRCETAHSLEPDPSADYSRPSK